MKILLVEDEAGLANLIKRGLEEEHYRVDVATDGQQGLQKAIELAYDLIILDVMLPFMNGIEVCQALRKKSNTVPVLMLTALGTTDDKVTGLDSGADDYLVKPFHFKELIARIRALIRRNSERTGEKIYRIADLELNMDTRTVKRAGQPVRLTAREFSLLEIFIKNKGRVLSRMDLAEKVWDIDFDTGTNVIDVYVNYLRNKIDKGFEPKLIHTIVGMGYVMREEIVE